MQFQIHGKNLDLTGALREHVEKKLGRLEKYFDEPLHVQVTLETQRDQHRAEATIPVAGYILRAEASSSDMYASIDSLWDKLERQIHKYKTRLNRKPRQEAARAQAEEAAAAPEAEGEESLVRVKRFHLKPMTVSEAVLQLELLGHDFFVFTNAETDDINVVYRRKKGGYGLIQRA
ncbi:MAG: ribosome-associated translation inhibitor RaiA [Clostridiales bacterium]|nr:ribosome-associated translation inhibitor RaiA [Clostridiales bacterium]